MVHGENTTVVTYGPVKESVLLTLRPLVAFRDYHHLTRQNDFLNSTVHIEDQQICFQPYPDLPEIFMAHNGTFETRGDWYYNLEYPVEAYRGLDCHEDLYSPGIFTFHLQPGTSARLILALEPHDIASVDRLRQSEINRRKQIVRRCSEEDDFLSLLVRAADAYVVKRSDRLSTIIAGYPWFSDWGRDTMIALPGLTLVTGRWKEARQILEAFANACDQGMIPNRFPDHGETPDYNSVDATLWYFHAVDRYLAYTGDHDFVRQVLWPVLIDIVHWFRTGTRYNIHLDSDGLLHAGEPGVQLTWMDAKVDDWVVTPRSGKPVEINALWYNALCVMAHLAKTLEDPARASEYHTLAEGVKTQFVKTFWNKETGCLYDHIDGDWKDPAIRPNQIFALSLPHRMLGKDQECQILDVIERDLLTPMGLRSLAPSDPAYQGHYGGDPVARDGAYHQGTVWGWLIGPFITAYVRLRKDTRTARTYLEPLRGHLYEACLGQVSEIFDGNPPHKPRGCFAQAWSVAELLRTYVEDVLGKQPKN